MTSLEIPAHWRLDRFRHHMRVREGLVDPRFEPWASTTLIAPDHVEKGTGRILDFMTASDQGADSGKTVVKRGDVIYSKIRPALNKVTIAPEDCLASADAYALVAGPSINTRFALYWMLARPFLDYATVTADRVKMPKINREELADAPWAVPPLPEQRAIAAYLDRETEQIDALVTAQEGLIATLRERRAAVVDGSIHPALGTRTKLVALSIGGIASGVDFSADEGEPTWLRYVRTTDIRGMTSLHEDTVRRITREQAAGSVIRRNDILFTRSGSLGVNYLHESDETMAFAGYMVRFRPDPDRCAPRFIAWWSQSRQHLDQIALGKTVSTIENFSGGKFAAMRIPLPPLDEQRRIADYLDERTAEIDALIAEAERFIALSKERRAALITAAVTGQVDVGSVA